MTQITHLAVSLYAAAKAAMIIGFIHMLTEEKYGSIPCDFLPDETCG